MTRRETLTVLGSACALLLSGCSATVTYPSADGSTCQATVLRSCVQLPAEGDQFPNPASTGVPQGWVPTETHTTDLVVTEPGSVVQDVRLDNANIIVRAPDVTIRRVELRGGYLDNRPEDDCFGGMLIEDATFAPPPGEAAQPIDHWRLATGGYTARRVQMRNVSDGFRVGGRVDGNCGPVVIEDSFIGVSPPHPCGDWHGDGIQGFDGPPLTVRNVTIDMREQACSGTAPFFVPAGQGNDRVDVDRLLVMEGGYSFRDGMPGTVNDLRIVDGSWEYGPIDVRCSAIKSWDAKIVGPVQRTDTGYLAGEIRRAQPCDTESGT